MPVLVHSVYLAIVYIVHIYCLVVLTVLAAVLKVVRRFVSYLAELVDSLGISITRALFGSEYEYIGTEKRTYTIAELIALHDQDRLYQQR